MKNLEQLRNKMNYENLQNWQKFIYGWKASIKFSGIKAIYKYPINYYKLWKRLKK